MTYKFNFFGDTTLKICGQSTFKMFITKSKSYCTTRGNETSYRYLSPNGLAIDSCLDVNRDVIMIWSHSSTQKFLLLTPWNQQAILMNPRTPAIPPLISQVHSEGRQIHRVKYSVQCHRQLPRPEKMILQFYSSVLFGDKR